MNNASLSHIQHVNCNFSELFMNVLGVMNKTS